LRAGHDIFAGNHKPYVAFDLYNAALDDAIRLDRLINADGVVRRRAMSNLSALIRRYPLFQMCLFKLPLQAALLDMPTLHQRIIMGGMESPPTASGQPPPGGSQDASKFASPPACPMAVCFHPSAAYDAASPTPPANG
jgi:hypothetical protein